MRFLVFTGFFIAFLARYYQSIPPTSLTVRDFSRDLQEWHNSGFYQEVYGRKMFVKRLKCSNSETSSPPTIILVHGFPSSTWDYHKALPMLREKADILLFDHLGFGFSDKPKENFTYGMMELADHALELWRVLGMRRAHIVAHDMGDSVMAEIITRRSRKLLPGYFDNFFQSITFTNGGMRVSLQSHRLSQKLLLLPYIGEFLSSFSAKMNLDGFSKQQFKSLWGTETKEKEMNRDITELIQLNKINSGHTILHKLIYYLHDRYTFEPRWLEALSKLDIPCQIVWGALDPVSPPVIAESIRNIISNTKLHLVHGAGHFLMLENPKDWTKFVLNFVNTLPS